MAEGSGPVDCRGVAAQADDEQVGMGVVEGSEYAVDFGSFEQFGLQWYVSGSGLFLCACL